ncbi:MAG: hypothetical protein KF812_00110 [Fimbriimonadaceae bacterium]|nr:hypothetical protein [Fimbriimonadaceae bacterium]
MPVSSSRRREAVRRLLLTGRVRSQEEVVSFLRAQGIGATQSSVSRDLGQLGAVRQGGRYVLPSRVQLSLDVDNAVVLSAIPAGPNLLVVRTLIGCATRLALEIDHQEWEEVIGTVAGDDTIFIATADASDQAKVAKRLNWAEEADHA